MEILEEEMTERTFIWRSHEFLHSLNVCLNAKKIHNTRSVQTRNYAIKLKLISNKFKTVFKNRCLFLS